ncbi:MAG: site-specific DNA-methyltransferase [Anaerolineae bacterium]|nr:site-specific DNA-methyltransferase [Anaerolineae bacterium]
MAQRKKTKNIETLKHDDAKRRNIPTAEYQSVMADEEKSPIQLVYERRNRDLDPQLVWRGKDEQDWSDLVVPAPPLYIQEKVHPKVLVDDLLRESAERAKADQPLQLNLFADFNGLPEGADSTDFYRHEGNWSNRLILGDSLQVMASLAEREGLRGKVQCIYIDPPYGIKFNSNFQWSTTSRDVKDGSRDHITREPEQVKAFRDTWRDGIHSYLTYLRDRLTVARDLLADSGSIFVQIGDENVHRVRAVMDEIFGEENFISQIAFAKTSGYSTNFLTGICDYILWYGKSKDVTKFRQPYGEKIRGESGASKYSRIRFDDSTSRQLTREEKDGEVSLPDGSRLWVDDNLTSQGNPLFAFTHCDKTFSGTYKTTTQGMMRLARADRIYVAKGSHRFIRFFDDFPVTVSNAAWMDIGGVQSRSDPKVYVVQTATEAVKRCILMTTDPGDLVLDPTCGSGTTATVAEQWGRRWITIDTSRVALALARARLMGARYPYYLLADSKAGQLKEAEVSRAAPSTAPTYGSIRHGFVYERVPHITLKSIANNAEIDVIWESYQEKLEPLRAQLNEAISRGGTAGGHLGDSPTPHPRPSRPHVLEEWQIPREAPADWPEEAKRLHGEWWELRIARQQEIDASIAAKADQEYLYDKPYEDKSTVRVAGPFTVESLSPHRVLVVNEDDELVNQGTYGSGSNFIAEGGSGYNQQADAADFAAVILENLKTAGVQQAHKEDRISFTALTGWPGKYICAEGRYVEGEHAKERRAGIFIGPEFGTVARPDLVAAAREAGDAGFDVLIACAFNYDAHSAEFEKLGRIPVLKARMNADLHMAGDLANTGAGNLFVIFGEPDIAILPAADGQIQVQIHGVDVFHPQSGEVRSSGPEGIACWFIDTNYNEESFFVRHAYFLGANDPYQSLKTTLKAEIDEEAWASLHSDVSRPFAKPQTGRIAVKVINHLGDEVMKVFTVP